MRNISVLLAGAVLALIPAIASAQTASPTPAGQANAASQLTVGASIYDASGSQIGTIDSVTGDSVVVATGTGTNKVAIPPASFGKGAKGPTLSATRAQLDAAASQAADASKAALAVKLIAGADVRGISGLTVVGKVKTVEADAVLVGTPKGDFRVPVTAFRTGPSGLVLGMTATEFDAAVAAASKPTS